MYGKNGIIPDNEVQKEKTEDGRSVADTVKRIVKKIKSVLEGAADRLRDIFGIDEQPDDGRTDDDDGGDDGNADDGEGGAEFAMESGTDSQALGNDSWIQDLPLLERDDVETTAPETHEERLLRLVSNKFATLTKPDAVDAACHRNPEIRRLMVTNHADRLRTEDWRRLMLDEDICVSKQAIEQAIKSGKYAEVVKVVDQMTQKQLFFVNSACNGYKLIEHSASWQQLLAKLNVEDDDLGFDASYGREIEQPEIDDDEERRQRNRRRKRMDGDDFSL